MSRIPARKNKAISNSGGIDFDYYEKRARQLRSDAFSDFFRAFRLRASAHPQVPTNRAVAYRWR